MSDEWISVSDHLPPSGVKVLAAYKNSAGKWRRICAQWLAANTSKQNEESEIIGDYDEATDTYYDPEGWYERVENWDDFSYIVVSDDVSHWRHLPDVPVEPPSGEK